MRNGFKSGGCRLEINSFENIDPDCAPDFFCQEKAMFIDSAKIHVKAGNGGNGCVSFRREKYVPAGGPDGGDGGAGGGVILLGDGGMHTLSDFRYKKKYAAQNGSPGGPSNRTGKSGEDLVIRVPLGTLAYEAASGRLIADITEDGQKAVIAAGGKGGAGNQHFATPTRQIPNFAKSGGEGESLEVNFELKVLADVGLVGFPNVGKSTLLSAVSSARPKIADYHFTTLTPNLGVVDIGGAGDYASFIMADIPGIIEGAHEGAGLGDAFLRHIERTRLLLHVVDAAGTEGRNPAEDYVAINEELKNYKIDLTSKPQIVVANKSDALPDGEAGNEAVLELRKLAESSGRPVFLISAATGNGVRDLISAAWERLREIREEEAAEVIRSGSNRAAGDRTGVTRAGAARTDVARPGAADSGEAVLYTIGESVQRYKLDVENGVYILTGQWLKKLVSDTNFGDSESLQYFQTMLKKYGVIDALEARGIDEGATVRIYDLEFDYIR